MLHLVCSLQLEKMGRGFIGRWNLPCLELYGYRIVQTIQRICCLEHGSIYLNHSNWYITEVWNGFSHRNPAPNILQQLRQKPLSVGLNASVLVWMFMLQFRTSPQTINTFTLHTFVANRKKKGPKANPQISKCRWWPSFDQIATFFHAEARSIQEKELGDLVRFMLQWESHQVVDGLAKNQDFVLPFSHTQKATGCPRFPVFGWHVF